MQITAFNSRTTSSLTSSHSTSLVTSCMKRPSGKAPGPALQKDVRAILMTCFSRPNGMKGKLTNFLALREISSISASESSTVGASSIASVSMMVFFAAREDEAKGLLSLYVSHEVPELKLREDAPTDGFVCRAVRGFTLVKA